MLQRARSWLKAAHGDATQAEADPLKAQPSKAGPETVSKSTTEQQRTQQQQPAAPGPPPGSSSRSMDPKEFFTDYGEANRYSIKEVIGKGSYGVVCSAVDNYTGEKVAIKKINNVFEHVSDATRILREIKLLRLLKHPDIVEIKHIMLPPSPRDFKDIYVVFELMETDLHQVIKANDDLTPEHHQFFLYQMLRGLKYIHSAKVFHRDLKPKNILANSDCKLKICDFGLARPAFNDMPTTVFWTDYVATRWYRAPELCGSFFAKYSPSIDTWSVGCIFAEVLLNKPLFPGRNVVHQLELITDCLGTPAPEVIAKVRNEKARRFLANMRKKAGTFDQLFYKIDPKARALLRRLLAFDPADRPSAEEALADPYFASLHSPQREPSAQSISKMAFEFERRKLAIDDVRELIYREILEYHPQVLQDYLSGGRLPTFLYPSAVDNFKRQFMYLEGQSSRDGSSGGGAGGPGAAGGGGGGGSGGKDGAGRHGVQANGRPIMAATSLPRERVGEFQAEAAKYLPQRTADSYGGSSHMHQHQQQHASMAPAGPAAAAAAAAAALAQQHHHHHAAAHHHAAQQQQAAAAAAAAAAAYHHHHHQAAAAAAQAQAAQHYSAQAQQAGGGGGGGGDIYKQMAGSQSVDALGCGVRSMTVVDHVGQPVQLAYAPQAPLYPTNPIMRSSSYQPAMQR